ncbi:nuclear transport factor 2 family protein [Kitasatospora sp. NPDC088134]|uniref:nuclear transport factor 2 family protein n=1 Tax=Kitasatospora sp. NPDC088134 TaxID=3364071 RepID=UPI003808E472
MSPASTRQAEPAYQAAQLATYQRHCEGWNRHDLDAALSIYTDDAHYEEKSLRWDLHGLDEIRDQFGPWFANTSDTRCWVEDSVHAPDRAAFMWRVTGLHVSGHRFDLPGISLLSFTPDWQVSHDVALWNLADLPEQAAKDIGIDTAAAYGIPIRAAANGRGTSAARIADSLRTRQQPTRC